MNAKYPEAYGTCYVVPTGSKRIIGVREGFEGTWFVGYVDGKAGRKRFPIFPLSTWSSSDPNEVQAKLDESAKHDGWKVAE